MKGTNESKDHTQMIRFVTHGDLSQSKENKCNNTVKIMQANGIWKYDP
jgi:hypothetical protein